MASCETPFKQESIKFNTKIEFAKADLPIAKILISYDAEHGTVSCDECGLRTAAMENFNFQPDAGRPW